MGLKEPRKTTPRSASNNTGRTPANNKDRNAHPTRTSATGEGNSRGKRERSREGVNSSKSVRKDNRQSPSLSVSALFNPLRHRKEVPQVPPGMYSVRQFQNNLAKAIIAKDVKRFQRLLRKYRKCCHSGGVMEHTGELVTSEEKPVNGDALAHSVLPDSSRSIVDRVVHFSTGYTMTHLAVVSWIHEFVDSCLEYGSAVHSYEDLNGDTALSLAISVQPELAFRMLQLGRDINIARVDIRGQNLLHNAVAVNTETSKWPGRIEFVKELLRRDPSLVLLKDPFGFTPAMWAAEHATQFASKEEYENIMNLLKTAEKAASLKRGRLSKEGNTKKDIGESEIKDESEVIKIDLSDEMSDSKESQDKHIMHVETRLSDSVRFFLEGPVTRLLCILLLLILHILEYAIDVADRGIEAQYRDAQFPFWFTIFNNIISCWVGSAFFMGLTHLACLAGAALIFAYLYYYAIHILLGKIVLRLPICGAISEAEEDFVQRSFGGYYLGFYKLSDRGGYFAKFIGALIGIFAGAKVYNILLHRFWPGQVWWAVIKSTITGLDAITALVGFWVVTLLLDWYIFTFVIDLLYQQGSLNVYLPHHTFGGFAETINKVLRWRKEIPLEKDIYGIRMTLYWSSLLAGWLIIILVFVLLEIYRGPAREVFLYPIIKTNWLGTPVIFASLSICLECIIAAQEWTWPTFQKHPFLEFPGLVITTHHAFFLMLLLLFLFSLDLRFIGAHIDLMRQQPGGIKTEDALLLALELIPAALGVIFIIILILRTSLWWGKCTIFGRNIELYAEHMRLLPCPLQSEKAALLAKEADTQKSSRFSRSLVNRGTRKNLKERSKIRKAVRNVEKQMQPTPANADTVQKKDKKKEEEEEQQQQQQQRQGLQPGVEDASASATPRLSLLWDRMFSGNRNSNSQSDISLVSQDEEMPESQEQNSAIDMPMAQRQQQHQHFRQQQQQQQQQHQQQQQKEEERLNPQAPMWIPKGGDAITMPTTVFPPFYPFAPPMSPYWGVAPVPSPVRPIAGYSIFSHTMGTGIPFPSPEQQAWIEARGNYLSSFQNLYMNRQPPSGVEREGYVNVPPLTVPFFQSGTFLRPNVGTVLATLPPASDLTRRDVMSQDLSTQKREGDVPQAAYQVESKVDVKNIEVWHRYLSESCSSCLLCGEDGHRYTSCRLFDGKSVCFVHIPTSYVYVMHHMHWIEGAKLRDVYFFIQNAMGLLQDQVVLFFNNQTIIFTDFSPETRCCDLQLLPGAIVGVSDQNLCIEEKLSSSMKQEMSLTRKSVQEVHPIGEKEAQTDVTFDVSTIARSSELSVSIPVAERRTKYPLEHTMEEISGSVSPTNKGDSTISFMARKSDEEEKSPMSIGDETAVPSSQTSKSGTVLSEGRDPILVTDSSQNSAFPFPNITTGITLRVNAPTMQGTLCGDGTLLDWATVSHDDKSSGMEERTPHMDSTITGVAVKDVVLSPSQTEDAAAEELRRRRTVHVKFIPVTMPFSAIRALLWSCGEVNKVRLVRPRTTAHPERTFYVCFAEYADDAGAARMIALHGCRVAGNFRLAVARSRDAIRGGFITDRDLNTGRPCTFGLNAVQIRQLGIPITTPPIVPPPPPPPTTTTTARAVIPPAREIMPLPPFSSLPKGPFPKLIIQEKREKGSGSSTIDPTEDISTKVEGGGSGDYVGRGPYTLEIVSAVEARKVQQQNPSLGGSGVEGSANVLSVAPRTQPVMKPFPEVASREALKRVEALRASLREAVLNHLRHRSSESFYNAFTLLEELRWSAVTALFHLELAVFEVLLFLNQDKVILSKDLQSCAYAAVRLGNELRQILQSVASNNSCIAPMWRLLFTTTPLAEQQEQEYGVVESEFEMAELQGSCDVSPIYPFLPNCLRFVELLLYIAVLLDISHKKRMLRCDKAETETETKGAALALLLPPQVNPLHEVESELLFSARRLLMQLQLEFSTEKGVSASTKCTWVDKVTSILQKIPSTGDWPDGNLIELFSTDLPKGSQDILLESVDFHLFCWV